jgi:hypothetical protein
MTLKRKLTLTLINAAAGSLFPLARWLWDGKFSLVTYCVYISVLVTLPFIFGFRGQPKEQEAHLKQPNAKG